MTTFKIATWNVNSLRVRLPHVLTWLNDVKPDVLALQETKLQNADFPFQAFQELGYESITSGQKTYNGVAIISRLKPLDVITDIPELEDPQRRVLAGVIGNIRVINLYIPNGESTLSQKYQYKLHWLKNLNIYLRHEILQHPNIVILGDFNIAPSDIDVHDPGFWNGQVLFSEPERNAFTGLLELGFMDCFRHLNPEEKTFTWWDYRMNAYKRNLGLRIDHILANSVLAKNCKKVTIDIAPRAWERPSDHVPVLAEFDLA